MIAVTDTVTVIIMDTVGFGAEMMTVTVTVTVMMVIRDVLVTDKHWE